MADWQHLADVLVAARVRLGYNRRAELVRARGLSHDRVLADLENAKRDNYEAATLVQVEHWYGLAPGNVREVLAGEPARYADAVSVSPDEESDGVYLDLGPDFYKGLTPTGERVLRADIAALKARLKADAERARAAADEL